MTRSHYLDAMEELGLDHHGMAKLLGVDVRTSRRYLDGSRRVPGAAVNFLTYILGKKLKAAAVLAVIGRKT
jgi:hypothetical protein